MYNAYWESQVGKKMQALLVNYMSVCPMQNLNPFSLEQKRLCFYTIKD